MALRRAPTRAEARPAKARLGRGRHPGRAGKRQPPGTRALTKSLFSMPWEMSALILTKTWPSCELSCCRKERERGSLGRPGFRTGPLRSGLAPVRLAARSRLRSNLPPLRHRPREAPPPSLCRPSPCAVGHTSEDVKSVCLIEPGHGPSTANIPPVRLEGRESQSATTPAQSEGGPCERAWTRCERKTSAVVRGGDFHNALQKSCEAAARDPSESRLSFASETPVRAGLFVLTRLPCELPPPAASGRAGTLAMDASSAPVPLAPSPACLRGTKASNYKISGHRASTPPAPSRPGARRPRPRPAGST